MSWESLGSVLRHAKLIIIETSSYVRTSFVYVYAEIMCTHLMN